MKREGMSLCAGDANNGMPLDDFEWPSKVALMVGSEPKGINPQLHNMIDNLIHIPKFDKVESLNVATATGIMLFAFTGTRKDIKVDLTWNPMNS